MGGAHWSTFLNVHLYRVLLGNPSREPCSWWVRGKTLSGTRGVWNRLPQKHQGKPEVDLRKQSTHHSGALHPVPLQKLTASLRLPELHRWSTPPRARGGNLGGVEHAVRNNLGGEIFFLLGSVKSLIYGFYSGPVCR